MTSAETKNNFDDFNNMFKGIDQETETPDCIAFMIVEKVKREHNQKRMDDAVEWFDESHFYEIRDWVNDNSVYAVGV